MADPGFTNGGTKDEAPQAPRSSAVGARIEAPQVECGRPSPESFSILDLKMATLGAFLALFFTVRLFGLNAKASSRG